MKKYQIIYADPPWSYKVWSEDKKNAAGYAKKHYPTMNVQDICNLPIKQIIDNSCKLFLWATPPCFQEALQVITAWGFEYKTFAFVWVKTNKKSELQQLSFIPYDSIASKAGIGHWTLSNAEICIAGLTPKGILNRQSASISQIILAPRREHSRKPDEVREKIIELCGDLPRIELFARQKTEGWDVWGNEVESDIEL